MDATKRLLAFRLRAIDPKAADITFTLESEGGELHTFAASDDVFGSLLRFMQDIEQRVRQDRPLLHEETTDARDLLRPLGELEVFLDLRGGRALLRASVAQGKSVQLELSEEVLARLQESIPPVLAALRKHKPPH
jgi:hypothetical protein